VQAQAAVVGRFRSGELNLLVATNIGSEGMDFKQCTAVVAFEPPPDVTIYIQVKGGCLYLKGNCYCIQPPPDVTSYIQVKGGGCCCCCL
jgi:hypothetical protein